MKFQRSLQYFEQFEFHGALAVSRNALSKSAGTHGLHSRYLCGTDVQMYVERNTRARAIIWDQELEREW